MEVKHLCFHLLIFLSIFTIIRSDDPNCVYTVYVRTGSMIQGGTPSRVGLTFYNGRGDGFHINDLEDIGLMGPSYDYYERGNLDIFSGRYPCFTAAMCRMNLTSNAGAWYVNYVEVTRLTTTGFRDCTRKKFAVEQWLSLDRWPYSLTASRDNCFYGGASMGLPFGIKTKSPVQELKGTI